MTSARRRSSCARRAPSPGDSTSVSRFLFSSRRRHTRLQGDWSSDVCSSDLRLQVTGRLGLHARAAANLVRVAGRFKSSLTLYRLDGGLEADAKSILSILTLAASRGTQLRVVANGVDEEEALDAVVGLFSRDFDEVERGDVESSAAAQQLRCHGLGVSDGLVVGRVLRLQEGTREVYRAQIAEADVERERRRFRAAVRLSRQQLETIKDRAEKEH